MKITGILAFAFFPFLFGGFYQQSFTRLDGSTVAASGFSGKKAVVFAFNGARPDWTFLHQMDSLQRADADSVVVLAFPGLEFDSTVSTTQLSHWRDSAGLQLTIAQPGHVRKTSGAAQLPLFRWLTTTYLNGHFGRDVEEDGMLFVVSRTGELYSVINKNLVGAVLPRVLGQ